MKKTGGPEHSCKKKNNWKKEGEEKNHNGEVE